MSEADHIRRIFAESLGVPLVEVTDKLGYNSRPEWDSVAHMALIAELDDAFDIMMETDDLLDLSTVAKSFEILRKYGVDV